VDVLQALADPVRLEMVRILAGTDEEISCGHIPLPVGKSTSSHHFRVLREAGVLRGRQEGTRRYYRLRRDDLDARFPGLLDSVLKAADALGAATSSAGGPPGGPRGGTTASL
jgi:DNA-binding transcriptional ArsR family regulator